MTMSFRKPTSLSPSLLAATDWMPTFTCWLLVTCGAELEHRAAAGDGEARLARAEGLVERQVHVERDWC